MSIEEEIWTYLDLLMDHGPPELKLPLRNMLRDHINKFHLEGRLDKL